MVSRKEEGVEHATLDTLSLPPPLRTLVITGAAESCACCSAKLNPADPLLLLPVSVLAQS